MEPPCRFQHIKIQRCWPQSKDLLRAYESQVTPQGRTYVMGDLIRYPLHLFKPSSADAPLHGTLQVCLLHTALFQDCAEDQLRDMHSSPPRALQCQNRPLLIEALAEALLVYEQDLQRVIQDAETLPAYMQKALSELTIARDAYEELYDRRRLARKPVTPDEIKDTWDVLTRMVEALAPDDYWQAAKISRLRYEKRLVKRMHQAFDEHGPTPRNYPLAAIYTAMP